MGHQRPRHTLLGNWVQSGQGGYGDTWGHRDAMGSSAGTQAGHGDVLWGGMETRTGPKMQLLPPLPYRLCHKQEAARNMLRAQPSSAGDKQHGGPTTRSHQGILFVPILQHSSWRNPLPQPTMVPILLLSPMSNAKRFPTPSDRTPCTLTSHIFPKHFKTHCYNSSPQQIPSTCCPCLHRGSPGPSREVVTTLAAPPPSLICSAPACLAPLQGVLLSPPLQQDPHLASSLGVPPEQSWGGGRARQGGQSGQHLVEGTLCPTRSYLSPSRGRSLTVVLRINGAASSSSSTSAKGNETGLCQPWRSRRGEGASLGTLRSLTCLPVLLAWGGLPGHGDLGLLCLVTGAQGQLCGHRRHNRDVCPSEGVRAAAGDRVAAYPES